jgi:hypothetical protein
LGDERVGNIATGKDFKTTIPGHGRYTVMERALKTRMAEQ